LQIANDSILRFKPIIHGAPKQPSQGSNYATKADQDTEDPFNRDGHYLR
jgi:hypothetical protein